VQRFLETDEVQALLAVAQAPFDTIIQVGYYTGLRPGELLALQWRDLISLFPPYFAPGESSGAGIQVTRSLYEGEIRDYTKTEAGIRVVEIPQPLVVVLDAYRLSLVPREPEPTDWPFPGKGGRPLPYRTYNSHFRALVKAAGLAPATPYALRHGHATMLVALGENPRTVADQLGHRDPSFTMKTYVHTARHTRSAVMAKLGRLMLASNTDLTTQTDSNDSKRFQARDQET
jgi:integrase